MNFFPPDPQMPEPEESESAQPPWWSAPEDELPALYPGSEVLARTEHAAIALTGVAVHRDGVELRIERRLRRKGLPAQEWHELCATFMEHHPWGGLAAPGGRLRFGLVLGNGERVFADFARFGGNDPMTPPEGHVLSRHGGGGGGGGSTFSGTEHLWLWPAPPPGPIELVMQWPALGIEETRIFLDADRMLELATRAQPLWPEPDEETI